MVNDAMDLFPNDPDFNIKAPEIDWVMNKPTCHDTKETEFERKIAESVDYNKIRKAEKIMRKAFDSDEQLKWGYICNVAMHLYDELCKDNIILKINRRNEIAEKLLKVIFYMGEE